MRLRVLQVPCLGAALCFVTSAPCASPTSGTPLQVEYAGCRAVLLPGPVCELAESRELRVWVGAPSPSIEIRAGGRRIDATGEEVGEGQRFSLTIPPGAQRLDLIVEASHGQVAWFLLLAELEEPRRQGTSRDLLDEVDETTRRVQADILTLRLARVRETLGDLWLPLKAPAESRYLLTLYRGFLAEAEGDYRSAFAEVQRAIEIAERAKMPRSQMMAEQQLALLLRGVGRARESSEIFARLRQRNGASLCDQAKLLTNQAWSTLRARDAGESFEDPVPLLDRASAAYEACGKATPEQKTNTLLNLALAHLQERRLSEAKDLLALAREREPHPPLPHLLWRLDLEARIALHEGRPAEALDLFDELEELALETSSADGRLRAAFGQAQSQEALEDGAAALETLRQAEVLLDEQSLQIPVQQGRETFMATRQALVSLHVEILLDQGRNAEAMGVTRRARSRVLRQLERSDRLANLGPERRNRWVHLLTEYQERRAALEERAQNSWRLPEDQVRHEQAARKTEAEAAEKLLDQAFRVLGDSTDSSEEVLAPPRPGELLLTWYPLPRGWVGFAADGETVMTHRFQMPALFLKGELSRQLLVPFSAAIEKAERIRILPPGHLQKVDFHSLPFDGDVLLAKRPVVYGLDLPVRSGPAGPSERHALLVADPRDDLPGALAEARTIREVLEAGSWITEELKGTGASAETVGRRLLEADLLHYAGHGTFSGFGGWESSLLLAGGNQLILGDLLALERVPSWVVLSGCETGRSSAETPIESLSLAHAFLLAGSRAVVASTRRADDRAVPALFAELYREWDREPDLAVALQRAQLSWRKKNPSADWPGFRLFEP